MRAKFTDPSLKRHLPFSDKQTKTYEYVDELEAVRKMEPPIEMDDLAPEEEALMTDQELMAFKLDTQREVLLRLECDGSASDADGEIEDEEKDQVREARQLLQKPEVVDSLLRPQSPRFCIVSGMVMSH